MSDNINVCWIEGSYHHSKEILGKIKESLGNHLVYEYDSDVTAAYIEHQILGDGLFSDNRLFILKDIPHFDKNYTKSNTKWKNLLSNLDDDCVVVFFGTDKNSRSVIYKHVKKIGKVFEFPKYIKKPEALSYVTDRFNHNNKNISDENSAIIVDSVGAGDKGYDIDELVMVVDKVLAYLGKSNKNVKKEDVCACLSTSNHFIIWDILNAVEDKDFMKCEKLLYLACLNSNNIKYIVESILTTLVWKFRLLLYLKECKTKKIDDEVAVKKISNIHKFSKKYNVRDVAVELEEDKNGPKSAYSSKMAHSVLKGFYGKKAVIDKFTRTEIFKAIYFLEGAMLKSRYCDNEYECLLLLDTFFMMFCDDMKIDKLDFLLEYKHYVK